MTTVTPSIDKIDLRTATVMMLAASLDQGLPWPASIRNNQRHGDLLDIHFADGSQLCAWTEFFGTTAPVKTVTACGNIFTAFRHRRGWYGWTVSLYAFEPLADPAMDDETRAIAARVIADVLDGDPVEVVPVDLRDCHPDDALAAEADAWVATVTGTPAATS